MTRRCVLCMFVAGIGIALTAAGYRLGYERIAVPLGDHLAEIPPAYLNLGELLAQDEVVLKLPVRNLADAPVDVAGIERSCTCAAVTPSRFTLPPGGTQWIQLRLRLGPTAAYEFARGGDLSIELRPIYAPAMTAGKPWRLAGRVRPAFQVSPESLRFQLESLVAGAEFAPLTFDVAALVPLDEVHVELDAESAAARLDCDLSSSAPWQVRLTPDAALAPGAHEFRVRLIGRRAADDVRTARVLRIFGRVVRDVAAEPSYVHLASQGRAPSRHRIALQSRTGTPFEVLDISAPSDVVVTAPDLAEGAQARAVFDVSMTGKPADLSIKSVMFHIRSANATRGEFDVPLQVVVR